MDNKIITVAIPTLGLITIYFGDVALDVMELFNKTNEMERQKEIKHLGLISTVIEGSSHSRYDYVMKQCALVELIGQLHSGNPNLSLGEITVDGIKYKGDALIKSWFLLSNFGHTKYTYGDEKALILHALKEKRFRRKLLKPILDIDLKAWCVKVIEKFDYSNMHYVLSIRRIYKENNGFPKRRERLLLIMKLLLLERNQLYFKFNNEKLEQLKRLFNIIRKLSIISIDAHHSHLPITLDLIPSILSLKSIENSYADESLVEQTNPFISLLHNELYINIRVLEAQRNYEIEAQSKIVNNLRSADIDEILKKAFTVGLVPERENKLKHFLRLKLEKEIQQKNDFKVELDKLAKVRRGCRETDYNIDHNPLNGVRYIDFFINNEKFTQNQLPSLIYNICNYIDDISKSFLEENSVSNYYYIEDNILTKAEDGDIDIKDLVEKIRSSAVLIDGKPQLKFESEINNLYRKTVWALMRYIIQPRFFWDVEIQTKQYPQFITFIDDNEGLKSVLQQAIIKEVDIDRAHELKQINQSLVNKFDGIVLMSLTRIKIFDSTMPPSKRLVTDIDGLVVKVNKEKLIIEFHEAKNKRNAFNEAKKDLNKNFIKILDRTTAKYNIREVRGMGAKLVITFES